MSVGVPPAPAAEAPDDDEEILAAGAEDDDEEELEALAVDDEWFDDDDDEEESEEDDAPPRVGIRLGAARAEPELDDEEDATMDPEVDVAGIVDVVETHNEDNFTSDGKPLDSEVFVQETSEVPFHATLQTPTQERPQPDDEPSEGDRVLPILAALTTTAGLAAGGVLVLVGLLALVSISSALDGPEAPPPPPPTDLEAEPAPPVGADEEEAEDDGPVDAADEEDGPTEDSGDVADEEGDDEARRDRVGTLHRFRPASRRRGRKGRSV